MWILKLTIIFVNTFKMCPIQVIFVKKPLDELNRAVNNVSYVSIISTEGLTQWRSQKIGIREAFFLMNKKIKLIKNIKK
jgi:hypothetical protein